MNKLDNKKMVQYSLWPNCNNNCKFCLKQEHIFYSLQQQIIILDKIIKNIKTINWNEYPFGVSLLGGEIFNITNKNLQEKFLEVIDTIIDNILVKTSKYSRFSFVSNGIYDSTFLFSVLNKFKKTIGMNYIDINFSYDLKYRYDTDEKRKNVIKLVNSIHEKYNYSVGIQMILTEYVIKMILSNEFNLNNFVNEEIKGNSFSFLYPHKIETGVILDDFQFKRADFLKFLNFLMTYNHSIYMNFIYSTRNSATFKYTGLKVRTKNFEDIDYTQKPILSNGKDIINQNCGHSILYKCYKDSDKCMLCDIINFDNTVLA